MISSNKENKKSLLMDTSNSNLADLFAKESWNYSLDKNISNQNFRKKIDVLILAAEEMLSAQRKGNTDSKNN